MSKNPKIKGLIGVKGRYKFIRRAPIIGPDGEPEAGPIVQESPWCKNILTLYYFNQAMQTTSIQPLGCVVGVGNTPPDENDTTLDSYLASTTTIQSTAWDKNWTVSPRYTKLTRVFRFAQGAAEGNVAEAGITITPAINSTTPIISRALVVDGGGSPTIIPVQEDEFLDVVWECTWFVPEDVTGSFTQEIDGSPVSFDYSIRAVAMNSARWGSGATTTYIGAYRPIFSASSGNFSGDFHSFAGTLTTHTAYESTPSGNANNRVINVTSAAYTNDSKQREHTVHFGLDQANIDISSFFISLGGSQSGGLGLGAFEVLIDPPVEKVSTKIYSFDFVLSMDNA
jgi:hypothetical protein